jgi:hypothetical protein
LVDVGATFTFTDDAPPPPLGRTVTVTSDEPAGAPPYSPDGTFTPPSTLRLRAERLASTAGGNGRIYVIVVRAVDSVGNVATDCCTVVVPLTATAGHLMSLSVEAAFVESQCEAAGGVPPPGYDHPILAPTPVP